MRIPTKYILIFLLSLLALWADAKQVWDADNIPIPYLRDSTQYVSDPDGYVGQMQRDSANYYLSRLNVECGVQNVLIIAGRVKDGDAFRLAQDVGNKYGIGYKGSRRGLVMVISVEDRKYFIAPGMGLEGELTDVDCDDIARATIVPNMRKDQPEEAVLALSRAIYNKVKTGRTGIDRVDKGPVEGEDDWLFIIILLLVLFVVPIALVIINEKNGGNKSGGKSRRRNRNDDWFPPFIFGGGGGFGSGGGGFSGGSFGGGSFGGGGAGGGW